MIQKQRGINLEREVVGRHYDGDRPEDVFRGQPESSEEIQCDNPGECSTI